MNKYSARSERSGAVRPGHPRLVFFRPRRMCACFLPANMYMAGTRTTSSFNLPAKRQEPRRARILSNVRSPPRCSRSTHVARASAEGRLMPDAADQLPIMPTVLCQTGFGHKTTFTILETRLDRAETGARLRSESDTRCLASRATCCCVPHAAARHLMPRSLAKCSRYRLVNLQRKARLNIGHRVAN